MLASSVRAAACAGLLLPASLLLRPPGTGAGFAPAPGSPSVTSAALAPPHAVAGMETGNIAVSVPPVPPHAALAGLCRAFLQGARQGEVQVLIGATGGTDASTTTWCHNYLKFFA